jgi:hypothetical protein
MDSAGTGAEPLKLKPRYRKAGGASSIGFRRAFLRPKLRQKRVTVGKKT